MWKRYGVVGLAVGGPPLAGIHLTAVFAAISTRNVRSTTVWLSAGLGLWTIILTIGSVFGFSLVGVR